jgi:hypothetical protein
MNSFNLGRLGLLIRNELYLHRRAIIIAAVAIIGVQFFHGLTAYSYVKKYGFDPYNIFLFGGGYLLTAFAFKSLHSNTTAVLYLMLPASPLIGLPLISLTAPLFWVMGYFRLKKSER